MTQRLEVDRRRLHRHAVAIGHQKNTWSDDVPRYLSEALPREDALPGARSSLDLFDVLQGLHSRYSDDFVPGIASTIFEVSEALEATVRTYGDAEVANTPDSRRSPVVPRRRPAGGSDIGDILQRPTE
jgi:hypothetical protein